ARPARPRRGRGSRKRAWRGPATRAPRGQGTGSVVVAILREWGRPAKVAELLPELERRGVKVGGKSPYNTLAATLAQHRGVKRAGVGLYEVAEKAAPGPTM